MIELYNKISYCFFFVDATCGPDTCVGLSSGTAGEKYGQDCTCQCLPHLPAFRDDLNICVDDIHGKSISHLN